ncbi:MAG TPA: HAMP domain-containing sensor histidine kinase [Mycobacteriales bacterium]|nr:HAMP domain-containing sensor histidine kinase [Mycobacteriales bacterium]
MTTVSTTIASRPDFALAAAGDEPRAVLIGRLGGFAGVGTGALLGLRALTASSTATDRWITVAIGVVALAVGCVLVRVPARIPLWLMDVTGVTAVGSLMLIQATIPVMRPCLPAIYLVIGTILLALRSWRVALFHTLTLGLSYAGALWLRPGPWPATRWLLLMSLVVTSGLFIRWLISMVVGLATEEQLARQAAERARIALERTSEQKSAFLARMSHELRTPLNVVLGFSELVGEQLAGPLNPRQQEYVADIADAARHLVSLVDEVLDPDSVEQGTINLEPELVDPADIAGDAVRLVRELARARSVKLVLDPGTAMNWLWADRRKLRQVVVNLLVNAIKYTPAGGEVVLVVRNEADGVAFRVSDTGVGISESDLGRIFEQFQQGTQAEAGSGLGLPLAREYAGLHGGEVVALSEVGVGSTFICRVPYRAGDRLASVGSEQQVGPSPESSTAFTQPGSPANRRLLARVAGWESFALAAVFMLAAVITPRSAEWRLAVGCLGIGVAGTGWVLLRWSRRWPRLGAEISAVVGVVAFTLATAYAGPFGDLVALNFGWIWMSRIALWHRGRSVLHLVGITVSYGTLLIVEDGAHEVVRFLALLTVLLVNGAVVDAVAGRLRRFVIAAQQTRQQAEDVQQRLDAASRHKSIFVANMSHELRTPLNAIIGFADLLAEGAPGPLNPTQADYIQEVRTAARHLLGLITDLLDLARLEAGQLQLSVDEVCVPMLLGRVYGSVADEAESRQITLRSTLDPRAELVVADEERLEQILCNLLSNAVKFTPDGGEVAIATLGHGSELVVSVSDTGIGIHPEQRATIFDPFSQGRQRRDDRVPEGTGVGLALVKGLVELHGGRIRLETEPGRGSIFVVAVPGLVDAADQIRPAPSVPAQPVGPSEQPAVASLGAVR